MVYKRMVQWASIYRDFRVNQMFHYIFPIGEDTKLPLSLTDEGYGVRPQIWYVLLEHTIGFNLQRF